MARKINVKLILKLREAQLSQNCIADSQHFARNSVSDVFRIAEERGITYSDVCSLSEAKVYSLFYPNSAPKRMIRTSRIKLPIPEEYGGGFATGETYEIAVRNLIRKVLDVLKGKAKGPLFSECWEKWIALKEGQEKSPATIATYRWAAQSHLLPYFGNIRIDEITADHIQEYYNSIMKMSASASTQSKAVLCGIFDRAARLGQIQRNPMLFKYERSRKKGTKVVLQDQELVDVIGKMEFLKSSGDDRDYIYFCFLCFTALRRGEILGLRWSDLDFERQQILVRNNVTYVNYSNDPVVREPKAGSSGTVYLQDALAEKIREYQKGADDYVIPYSASASNKPITKSMFTKIWSRITKTIDLKGATSHSFRASYATMLNAHCDHVDPKVIQSALRHKTPDLAIRVYTKPNAEKARRAEQEYEQWLKENLT